MEKYQKELKYQRQKVIHNLNTLYKQIEDAYNNLKETNRIQYVKPLFDKYRKYLKDMKKLYPKEDIFDILTDYPENAGENLLQTLRNDVKTIIDNFIFDDISNENEKLIGENEKLKKENEELKRKLKKYNSYQKIL